MPELQVSQILSRTCWSFSTHALVDAETGYSLRTVLYIFRESFRRRTYILKLKLILSQLRTTLAEDRRTTLAEDRLDCMPLIRTENKAAAELQLNAVVDKFC